MALIVHVTPITPRAQLERLAGRAFMVRWGRHDQVALVERIGSVVVYENGAFGFFRQGIEMTDAEWIGYYEWLEPRLFHPGRWAIIPDVIGAGSQLQDALLRQWPYGARGAPVWHMDEPIDRLTRLLDEWPRVCIGATGDYFQIWKPGATGRTIAPLWLARMTEIWDVLARRRVPPVIHMLRGTAVAGMFPFDSADSSSAGQNAHRHRKAPLPLFPSLCGGVDYADKLERNGR